MHACVLKCSYSGYIASLHVQVYRRLSCGWLYHSMGTSLLYFYYTMLQCSKNLPIIIMLSLLCYLHTSFIYIIARQFYKDCYKRVYL